MSGAVRRRVRAGINTSGHVKAVRSRYRSRRRGRMGLGSDAGDATAVGAGVDPGRRTRGRGAAESRRHTVTVFERAMTAGAADWHPESSSKSACSIAVESHEGKAYFGPTPTSGSTSRSEACGVTPSCSRRVDEPRDLPGAAANAGHSLAWSTCVSESPQRWRVIGDDLFISRRQAS